MDSNPIWLGLEREVRRNGAAFTEAQRWHAPFARYATLLDAIEAHRGAADGSRDEFLRLLLIEHRAKPAPVWTAAMALTVRPMLRSLLRQFERRCGDDVDGRVFTAFLEAVAHARTTRRFALRLYSETRRRVVRHLVAEATVAASTESSDVDAIPVEPETAAEELLDRARVVRRAAVTPPREGETLTAYAIRIRRAHPAERVGLASALRSHRTADLTFLRNHFSAVA